MSLKIAMAIYHSSGKKALQIFTCLTLIFSNFFCLHVYIICFNYKYFGWGMIIQQYLIVKKNNSIVINAKNVRQTVLFCHCLQLITSKFVFVTLVYKARTI